MIDIYIHYFSEEFKFIEYPRVGLPLLLFIFNIKTKFIRFFSDSEMSGAEKNEKLQTQTIGK